MLAIISLIDEGVLWFKLVHGRTPKDWQEFVESPFTPIPADAVNPLTGGPIYADGRSSDISVEFHRDGSWSCRVVGADGKHAWAGSDLD
jgi:hypothetical protein